MEISLFDSYQAVSLRKSLSTDFDKQSLQSSLDLFEDVTSEPIRPRALEVVALVGGLPFEMNVIKEIIKIQDVIKKIIGLDTPAYFVEPQNLAIELAVLKWPQDIFESIILVECSNIVPTLLGPYPIEIDFYGFQFHNDGCVVMRGFDRNGRFRQIRSELLKQVPSLPQRQSNWSHIPLGRILSPVGIERFSQLIMLEKKSQESYFTSSITDIKLVREHRWYMVDREVLCTFACGSL